MTLEELAQKAIEESNGKTFLGVGQPQPRQECPAPVHRVSAVHRPKLHHGVRVAAAQEQQDLRSAHRRLP